MLEPAKASRHLRKCWMSSMTGSTAALVLALAACGNFESDPVEPEAHSSSFVSDSASASPSGADNGASSMLHDLALDGAMPLVRTDFTDDEAWRRIVAAVTAEVDGPEFGGAYAPYVRPVDDRQFDGATGASLTAGAKGTTYGYVILADARSMRESTGGDLTVALVDLSLTPEDAEEFGLTVGREFRSAVTEVAAIEANLSTANMDFEEFADSVGEDGVYRGF